MVKDRHYEKVVNNGKFSFVRGERETSAIGGYKIPDAMSVDVDYKVIYIDSTLSERILKILFGADKGGYSTKSAQLMQDYTSDYITSANAAPGQLSKYQEYKKQPFVVARVTFPAEFMVHLRTPVVGIWDYTGRAALNNYLDLSMSYANDRIENDASETLFKSEMGGNLYLYTTYYAVLP
jgi:hypothetical protein